MAEFFIKRNDTSPALTAQFKDSTGTAINLTSATVRFTMTGPDGQTTKKVNRGSCTVTDAANGKVSYAWSAADTATAGRFKGEFEATLSDLTVRTFPNPGTVQINIEGDLDET